MRRVSGRGVGYAHGEVRAHPLDGSVGHTRGHLHEVYTPTAHTHPSTVESCRSLCIDCVTPSKPPPWAALELRSADCSVLLEWTRDEASGIDFTRLVFICITNLIHVISI